MIYIITGLGRGRLDNMDPFLPCHSHHFESIIRPVVLSRRSNQGTERSTSSGNTNTTESSSTPTSNDIRPISVRRTGRPRTRYVQDSEGFLPGIHPILTWGRNHRNNTATTYTSSNVHTTGQGSNQLSDTMAGNLSKFSYLFYLFYDQNFNLF